MTIVTSMGSVGTSAISAPNHGFRGQKTSRETAGGLSRGTGRSPGDAGTVPTMCELWEVGRMG